MKNIVIDNISAVNVPALDQTLRAALGEQVFGLSYSAAIVTVHLSDQATKAQENQARALVQAHDPAVLTPDQQAEINRQAKLDQARRDYGAAEIDLTLYEGKDSLLQQLATKIAWLEREVDALRKPG
jgi:hypothetical protein